MPVEFRMPGPVEAWVDGRPPDIGYARQRGVLAALVQELFGTAPPARKGSA